MSRAARILWLPLELAVGAAIVVGIVLSVGLAMLAGLAQSLWERVRRT